MIQETRFPAVIDNTLLKAWRRCPQYLFRRHVQGLRLPDEESVDLLFGQAFATGVERARKAFYVQGNCEPAAADIGMEAARQAFANVSVPMRSSKTLANLHSALVRYFGKWPLGADGLTPVNDGIEYAFSFPLPFEHPDTGERLLYAGRCDMVAMNEAGGVVIVDEKTAGGFSDAWLAQWDMDPQMTGYIYALDREGRMGGLPHALIRGVQVGSRGFECMEVPVFRTDYQLAIWYEQVVQDVVQMKEAYRMRQWDYRTGSSCVMYNRPCEYTRLCTSPPAAHLLEGYKVEFWSPLEKGEDNGKARSESGGADGQHLGNSAG